MLNQSIRFDAFCVSETLLLFVNYWTAQNACSFEKKQAREFFWGEGVKERRCTRKGGVQG